MNWLGWLTLWLLSNAAFAACLYLRAVSFDCRAQDRVDPLDRPDLADDPWLSAVARGALAETIQHEDRH